MNAQPTDRELLELAARAARLTLRWVGDEPSVPYTPEESAQRNGVDGYMWNPLNDDGDALRLAVKLRFLIDIEAGYAKVLAPNQSSDDFFEPRERLKPDPYAATRRAIVRGAAEIGRITGSPT